MSDVNNRKLTRSTREHYNICLISCKLKISFKIKSINVFKGFPDGSVVKNLPANRGDLASISGSGRSPGQGNGNPLQYSCLGNPMDRGAWPATVHGVARELDTT